jgi:hypothetical protein
VRPVSPSSALRAVLTPRSCSTRKRLAQATAPQLMSMTRQAGSSRRSRTRSSSASLSSSLLRTSSPPCSPSTVPSRVLHQAVYVRLLRAAHHEYSSCTRIKPLRIVYWDGTVKLTPNLTGDTQLHTRRISTAARVSRSPPPRTPRCSGTCRPQVRARTATPSRSRFSTDRPVHR